MATAFGLGLGLPFGGGVWSPADLGSSLLGWWDAERTDKLTLSGSSVTTWTDIVGSYAATQAVGASKPVWSATSFNNRPGITFDGADDELTLGSAPFPTGASASRMWLLVDQVAPVSDLTGRMAFGYGDAATTSRRAGRAVDSGVNRANARTGTGAGSTFVEDLSVSFLGRHVVCVEFSPTTTGITVDGGSVTSAALVPSTATNRTRIGAATATAAAEFFQGVFNTILVDDGSAAAKAKDPQILAYLNARKA
jgi:hypothetical protein